MWPRLAQSWHVFARRLDALPAWLALSLGVAVALLAWLAPGALVIVPLLLVAAGALAFTAQPLAVTVEELTAPPGALPRKYKFDVVTLDARGKVKERRRATARGWAERLPGGVLLEMVEVPGGTFLMGSPESEAGRYDDEGPQHRVTVPAFAISRYPVTQAQWRAATRLPRVDRDLWSSPSYFDFLNRDWPIFGSSLPVEQVSWYDALECCARLTKASGRVHRLPSESEWEYSARAGTTTPFHFGAMIAPKWVNYEWDQRGTTRARAFPIRAWSWRRRGASNEFGLSDVHGNVWEWCQDVWHADYTGAPTNGSAWESGGSTNRRVLRGGAWRSGVWDCRSAARNRGVPEYRDNVWGFRVVCAVSRNQGRGAL